MKFKKSCAAPRWLAPLGSRAKTVRIANQGDALSMDPHSLNESLQLSVTGNVYEPLVGRNKDLSLARWPPAGSRPRPRCGASSCARACSSTTARPSRPTTWCSASRTQVDGSDMKSYTNDIKEVRKIDDHTVEIETKAPFPSCPT
jgi:peptide/nickel transport system substrate-binding protein